MQEAHMSTKHVGEKLQGSGLAPRPDGPALANRRIGLALGGGGARGLAHVAVLEAFDELGLKPAVIAGTSIGAIFGAAYASGLSAAHIRALTEETLSSRWTILRQVFAARSDPSRHLARLFPLRSALLKPEAVLDIVLPTSLARSFEDLEIALKITATDLASNEPVVFERGDLVSAIAASIAIPIVFSPVKRDGSLHLDGGLVNPCPFDLLMPDCDVTVAVDVSGASGEIELTETPSAVLVAVQTAQIMQKAITRERLRHMQPDIYLDVGFDRYGAFSFTKAREIIAAAEPFKSRLKTQLARILSSELGDARTDAAQSAADG